MTPAALAKRLGALEAEVDVLAPKPDPEKAELEHFLRWATCDELVELELLYRRSEEAGFMAPADEARGQSILYAIEARRLAGEPPDDEKPRPPSRWGPVL